MTGLYYRSLSYEIQDNEVIVRVGIWTQSVKHVPYRTVTNLQVKRDILDRWFFGLGTLNIQTAGMSGTTGAEEILVGLPNVQSDQFRPNALALSGCPSHPPHLEHRSDLARSQRSRPLVAGLLSLCQT